MDLQDKTCLITGANSGLGFAAAKQFARSGAKVVLVCRDSLKGAAAIASIKEESPEADLEPIVCDLTSIKSIRHFAAKFKETHPRLNLLFNNAAVMKSKHTTTEDGFETMFQTNYLAPVILTEALLDLLKSSSPARIINIAVPPDKLRIDFNDLQSSGQYKSFDAFMRTKLYLLLYTIELSEKLKGTGIIVNAIDPGMFRSGLSREFPWLLRKMAGFFARSADEAAAKILFRAASNETEADSGKIFSGKGERSLAPYWNDASDRRRLLSVTESLIP